MRILEGPDAIPLQVHLFRHMQNRPAGNLNWFGKELSKDKFVSAMEQEHRLIYEFEIDHCYGMV